MKDNEIIKALERMSEEDPNGFSSDILDLINRHKAEIERLKKAIKVQDIMIEQQDYKIKKAKSEARKEFAERLKLMEEKISIAGIEYQVITTESLDIVLAKKEEKI